MYLKCCVQMMDMLERAEKLADFLCIVFMVRGYTGNKAGGSLINYQPNISKGQDSASGQSGDIYTESSESEKWCSGMQIYR